MPVARSEAFRPPRVVVNEFRDPQPYPKLPPRERLPSGDNRQRGPGFPWGCLGGAILVVCGIVWLAAELFVPSARTDWAQVADDVLSYTTLRILLVFLAVGFWFLAPQAVIAWVFARRWRRCENDRRWRDSSRQRELGGAVQFRVFLATLAGVIVGFIWWPTQTRQVLVIGMAATGGVPLAGLLLFLAARAGLRSLRKALRRR